MTAAEIRKFYEDNIRGEVDGTLDEHNLCNALLGEIAAQLAEVNESKVVKCTVCATARLATAELINAGDAMAQELEHYTAATCIPSASVLEWQKVRG